MVDHKQFETERLLIKPTSVGDAEFIFELFNTPKWIEHIGDRNITSVEIAKDYFVHHMQPQLIRLGYATYTLIKKLDHVKIGTCGFYDREGLEGIDIGFALLPDHERKGFAYEAATKLIHVAFNEFGMNEISAITSKKNTSSQKLLEKLGLEMTGTTRLPNNTKELLVYKIEK